MNMNIKLILKFFVAIATAILGVLGASALSSCSVERDVHVRSNGFGVFKYVDTIHTSRNTNVVYPRN